MYTFYFKELTGKKGFVLAAVKGRMSPKSPCLGEVRKIDTLQRLVESGHRIVILPETPTGAGTDWDSSYYDSPVPTMRYAKGYRGPKLATSATSAAESVKWNFVTNTPLPGTASQTVTWTYPYVSHDRCQEDFGNSPSAESVPEKPVPGPLPPQAPISISTVVPPKGTMLDPRDSVKAPEPMPWVKDGYEHVWRNGTGTEQMRKKSLWSKFLDWWGGTERVGF